MDIQANEIWIAAGVLLGFQVTAFGIRINREITAGDRRGTTWIPPSDLLSLSSMVVLIVGIFILPVFDMADPGLMTYSFGLAMLLFMGYPCALAGHYDMYNNKTGRSGLYFPIQEQIVISVVIGLAIVYIIIAMT